MHFIFKKLEQDLFQVLEDDFLSYLAIKK